MRLPIAVIMKTVIAICALLWCLTSSAEPQPTSLLERSREYVKWLQAGETNRLWSNLTPDCRKRYFKDTREEFARNQRELADQYGTQTSFVTDTLVADESYHGDYVYTHDALYTKNSKPVRITFGLDPTGSITWLYFFEKPPDVAPQAQSSSPTNRTIGFTMAGIIALVTVTAGLITVIVIAFARRQARRDGERWAGLAAALGFQFAPWITATSRVRNPGPTAGQLMTGSYRGRSVEVFVRSEQRDATPWFLYDPQHDRPIRRTVYFTCCRARIDPPLLMGLKIEPKSLATKLVRQMFGHDSVELGDSAFDSAYMLQTIDPMQARSVLSSGAESSVAQSMVAYRSAFNSIAACDQFVNLEYKKIVYDARAIDHALSVAVYLADRLQFARRNAPPAQWEQTLTEGWSQVASSRSMIFDRERAELSGRMAGIDVSISVSIEDGKFRTNFAASLGELPVAGLRLFPQGGAERIARWLGMEDVQIGDPEFDQRFVVQGQPAQKVSRLFTRELSQQLLLMLSKASWVGIENNRLRMAVGGMIVEGSLLSLPLDDLTRAAQLLLWARGTATAQTTMG